MVKGKCASTNDTCIHTHATWIYSVWLQLLSRDQQTSAVVKLHLDQFSVEESHGGTQPEILWHETSTAWINITDVYYFMQSSDTATMTRLIWSSEKVNGYRHLFLVEKAVDQQEARVTQLTDGEWCCVNRPLYVDEARSLVYFSAKMHTPLETHFYVTPYSHQQQHQPTLLTKLGFSHTVTMDSPDYFIDCFSTIHDPQVTVVQKLSHSKANAAALDGISLLIPVSLKSSCETPPSPPSSTTNFMGDYRCENRRHSTDQLARDLELTRNRKMSKYSDSVEPNGEIFSFATSDGNCFATCPLKTTKLTTSYYQVRSSMDVCINPTAMSQGKAIPHCCTFMVGLLRSWLSMSLSFLV